MLLILLELIPKNLETVCNPIYLRNEIAPSNGNQYGVTTAMLLVPAVLSINSSHAGELTINIKRTSRS